MGLAARYGAAEAQVAPRDLRLEGFCLGIDKYASIRPLERAANDANTIADRLTGLGYNTVRSIDRGRDAIYDDFYGYIDRLDKDSAAFLFLAGHGLQVSGRNYLLPADIASLDDPAGLEKAIPIDEWLEELTAFPSAQTIIILDACRNDLVGSHIPDRGVGFASTKAPAGVFIAYSAGFGEYALDKTSVDDCSRNGLFTRHFVEELKPRALIYDAITNTRAKVIPEAQESGHAQHPAIYDQSSWPYRVNGNRALVEDARTDAVGELDNTGLMILAASDYSCIGSNLVSPMHDCDRVARAFESYGSAVEILKTPSKAQLLSRCREMAERGHDRIVFYFMGLGGCIADQAACFLPKSDCGAAPYEGISAFAETDRQRLDTWFDIVSHSDLIEAFGFASDKAEPGSSLLMLYDACLTVDLLSNRMGELNHGNSHGLKAIDNSTNIGLLSASSVFQPAFDLVDGTTSSPFTIAVLNALAIPGLTLAQFSDRVRAEVETLTERVQTPRLFASPALKSDILVRPRDRNVARACPSA